jgi:hypothetical protein
LGGARVQASGEFEEEQERLRVARDELPPVEKILGLDEMEVRVLGG